ncbi:MAG: hypothetical protein KDB86_08380 [Actinobacteria bacterium]|nr:hypothetical protein [Actinomycetota bacterium]MCB9388313.1 hypothetical protein [Acidimicrobiia bacterium]
MSSEIENLRKDLDEDFADFRKDLGKIHDKVAKLDAAGPEDDVYQLLEDLEDTVKKVRTGGLFGSGAKSLRKARDAYLEAKG